MIEKNALQHVITVATAQVMAPKYPTSANIIDLLLRLFILVNTYMPIRVPINDSHHTMPTVAVLLIYKEHCAKMLK